MATPALEHRYLRSAIEFAVALAQRTRAKPPLAYPAALKPFVRQPQRIPTGALGKLRRAIDADPEFRRRLADGAVPELVDAIGIEWLRHDDGWEERVAELVAADKEAVDPGPRRVRACAGPSAGGRPPSRRPCGRGPSSSPCRSASTQLAAQLAAERAGAAGGDRRGAAAASRARRGARWPSATPTTGPRRRAELAGAGGRARRGDRREPPRPSASVTTCSPTAPSAAASTVSGDTGGRAARAGRLGAPAGRPPRRARRRRRRPARVPVSLPGGVARDSRRATEFLLRAPGALVLVDGYNVAKLGWPDEDSAAERRRCIDLVRGPRPPARQRDRGRLRRRRVSSARTPTSRRTVRVRLLATPESRRRRHPRRRRRRRRSSGRSSSSPTTSRCGATSRPLGANLVTSEAFLQLR